MVVVMVECEVFIEVICIIESDIFIEVICIDIEVD